jgi:hypothetical protein
VYGNANLAGDPDIVLPSPALITAQRLAGWIDLPSTSVVPHFWKSRTLSESSWNQLFNSMVIAVTVALAQK